MQFGLSTLTVALAALVATTEGCLRMTGQINADGSMIINVNDNGVSTCTFWGTLNGQPQGLNCIGGFAAWVQLRDRGTGFTGQGTLAYANGGNNYRIPVGSTAHSSGSSHYWKIFADSWC